MPYPYQGPPPPYRPVSRRLVEGVGGGKTVEGKANLEEIFTITAKGMKETSGKGPLILELLFAARALLTRIGKGTELPLSFTFAAKGVRTLFSKSSDLPVSFTFAAKGEIPWKTVSGKASLEESFTFAAKGVRISTGKGQELPVSFTFANAGASTIRTRFEKVSLPVTFTFNAKGTVISGGGGGSESFWKILHIPHKKKIRINENG